MGGPHPCGESTTYKRLDRGTHRVVTAAETLIRLRPLLAPVGITRVANVTGLDLLGIPVVMVCRPNARSLAISQGKGRELDAAKASGVMESLELYHAERICLPLVLATHNELRYSRQVVKVQRLPRTVHSNFHNDRALLWVEGSDLLTQRRKLLPFELVHTNFVLPLPTGSGAFVLSSNGLASGNHILEAIVHGLCEVIERDAATLHWLQGEAEQARRRVRLSSVDDPDCRRLLDLLDAADMRVGIWDITSDVGVPAYRCIIAERDRGSFRSIGPIEGYGCHLARGTALSRAITEAAQGRLTLIAGARDDNDRRRYQDSKDAALYGRSIKELSRDGQRAFHECEERVHADLDQDLSWILERLAAAHVDEVLVVDLSKREFQVPVVRVVVPGLETYHHIRGFAPGVRALELLRSRGAPV